MPNFLSGATDILTTLYNHAEDLIQSMPGSFLPSADNDLSSSKTVTQALSPERVQPRQTRPIDKLLEGTWGSEINISDDEGQNTATTNTRAQLRRSRAQRDNDSNMSWAKGSAKIRPADFLVSQAGQTRLPAARSTLSRDSKRGASTTPQRHDVTKFASTDLPETPSREEPPRKRMRVTPEDSAQRTGDGVNSNRTIVLDQRPLQPTHRQPLRDIDPTSLEDFQDDNMVDDFHRERPNGRASAKESRQRGPTLSDPPSTRQANINQQSGERPRRNSRLPSPPNHSQTPSGSKIVARYQEESPDIIQGGITVSSTARPPRTSQELKPPSNDTSLEWDLSFELKRLVCSATSRIQGWTVSIDTLRKKLHFHLEHPKDSTYTVALRSIGHVVIPEDDDSNILKLELPSCSIGTNVYLELCSEKARRDFTLAIIGPNNCIGQKQKPSGWLHRAIEAQISITNNSKNVGHVANASKSLPRAENVLPNASHTSNSISSSRRKRSHSPGVPILASAQHQQTANTRTESSAPCPSLLQSTTKLRNTRSSTVNTDVANATEQRRSQSRRKEPPWKKPLVYPPNGKRKETVTWDDLECLEDDTFLNDSLIGLFLRYLQEHSSQDNISKIHFFNSFFYEALTRNVDRRRGEVINYNNVASWTKNINIFTRDFVVVPVNENLHWYVMIMCNLRGLANQKNILDEDGVITEDPPNISANSPEQDSKIILQSHLISDTTLNTEGGFHLDHSNSPRTGRKKKLPRARRKYDINKPVIITLDSFEIPRSQTATVLKHYLIEEAKKHNLELERDDIQGMTAKGIPKQPNFSDCGLYMCLYMEQFMRDPYAFVKWILQRETNTLQWPSKIASSELRDRYYNMLQEMHRAQRQKRLLDLPPVGEILVKMVSEEPDPASGVEHIDKAAPSNRPLSPRTVRAGVAGYSQYRVDVENSFLEEASPLGDVSHRRNPLRLNRERQNGNATEAITIEEDSQEQHATGKSSPYFVSVSTRKRSASPGTTNLLRNRRASENGTVQKGESMSLVKHVDQLHSPRKQSSEKRSFVDLSSPAKHNTSSAQHHAQASSNTESSQKLMESINADLHTAAERPSTSGGEATTNPMLPGNENDELFGPSERDRIDSDIDGDIVENDIETPFEGFDDLHEQRLGDTSATVSHARKGQFSRTDRHGIEIEDSPMLEADQALESASSVPETLYTASQDQDGDIDMLLRD